MERREREWVMSGTRSWIRGGITLAILGGLLAATLMSPVGAAFNATKKKVRKISATQANKVVDAENSIVHFSVGDAIIDVVGQPSYDLEDPATRLGTLTLPPGRWWVHTDFTLQRAGDVQVICDLLIGGTVVDGVTEYEVDNSTLESVSMQGAATLPNGGTAEVRCDDAVDGGTSVSNVSHLDISGIEGSSLAAA
jgi:hypothetical protein